MNANKKHWMGKALALVTDTLTAEDKVQDAIQIRLVTAIANALELANNEGFEAGEHANCDGCDDCDGFVPGEHVDCDDEECDDCNGNFIGAKFAVGQKVKAIRKNWTQLARDMYSKETYTVTDRSRNDADEIEYELTSDLYKAEKMIVRQNDVEWEIYEAL